MLNVVLSNFITLSMTILIFIYSSYGQVAFHIESNIYIGILFISLIFVCNSTYCHYQDQQYNIDDWEEFFICLLPIFMENQSYEWINQFYYCGVCNIVSIIGIFGNIFSIIILYPAKYSETKGLFYGYLTALAYADLLFLLSNLIFW